MELPRLKKKNKMSLKDNLQIMYLSFGFKDMPCSCWALLQKSGPSSTSRSFT